MAPIELAISSLLTSKGAISDPVTTAVPGLMGPSCLESEVLEDHKSLDQGIQPLQRWPAQLIATPLAGLYTNMVAARRESKTALAGSGAMRNLKKHNLDIPN